MDCNKIIKIYNESCFVEFSTTSVFVFNKVSIMDLNFKKDQTCLESMKMLEKYCKPENKQK
jgi:hypothetical protein